jgi:hypothetical protein
MMERVALLHLTLPISARKAYSELTWKWAKVNQARSMASPQQAGCWGLMDVSLERRPRVWTVSRIRLVILATSPTPLVNLGSRLGSKIKSYFSDFLNKFCEMTLGMSKAGIGKARPWSLALLSSL